MRLFYVYIMTNRPDGTLYVGVTNNIGMRSWQHREGIVDGLTKRYGLKRLVYYEAHESIIAAIQREKNIKHWPRTWKVRLPRTRTERLVAEQTSVTPDTALRLAKFFRTSPEFWMNMQAGYDLKIEAASKKREIAKIRTLNAA